MTNTVQPPSSLGLIPMPLRMLEILSVAQDLEVSRGSKISLGSGQEVLVDMLMSSNNCLVLSVEGRLLADFKKTCTGVT